MNGGVVAYYSGRQSTVAFKLCTPMAEIIALAKIVLKIEDIRAIYLICNADTSRRQ
jgi:hypothetical protein